MPMRTAVRVVSIVLLVSVLLPVLAAACPLCKEAASEADKAGSNSMWRGMYWSILLMVGAPFAMVGAFIIATRRWRRPRVAALPRISAPLPFPGSNGERS
jgi:hypothetical protein